MLKRFSMSRQKGTCEARMGFEPMNTLGRDPIARGFPLTAWIPGHGKTIDCSVEKCDYIGLVRIYPPLLGQGRQGLRCNGGLTFYPLPLVSMRGF
jgi:hypothetical protein